MIRFHRGMQYRAAAFLAFAVLAVAAVLLVPGTAYAAKDVTLQDGETCNLSALKGATNVHVKAGGAYTITGSSKSVMLYVNVPQGQTATIRFSGQVSLTPNSSAPGIPTKERSAITVAETGGEVVLSSDIGSYTTIKGYKGVPALRKDGTSTKLRFRTQDPSNPGTISVSADESAYRTCAIGGYGRVSNSPDYTAGELYFESGNVEAYGSRAGYNIVNGEGGGAAIGGDFGCHVKGIYISGGTVLAVAGDTASAAIGTTSMSVPPWIQVLGTTPDYFDYTARDIVISGGTVRASQNKKTSSWAGGGSAIGGGRGGTVVGVTVSGGVVSAEGSDSGTAIGGGYEGDGLGIKITGGEVRALAGGNAIGGGNSTLTYYKDRYRGDVDVTISGGKVEARSVQGCSGIGGSKRTPDDKKCNGSVTITGGEVYAYGNGYGSGIGAGSSGVMSRITISGGEVYAEGGDNGVAIGTGDQSRSAIKTINITGGTVVAVGGAKAPAALGGYSKTYSISASEPTPIYISGGNVKVEKGLFKTTAKQSPSGPEVFSQKVSIETFGDMSPYATRLVSELSIMQTDKPGSPLYPYGVNGFQLFKDTYDCAVWVPTEATITSMRTESYLTKKNDNWFTGRVKAGGETTLYPSVKLTLTDAAGSGPDRHPHVMYQNDGTEFYLPHSRAGYTLRGYSPDEAGATMLLDSTNALIKDVAGYTSNGVWTLKPTQELYQNGIKLYAQWQTNEYLIAFDGNKPVKGSQPVLGVMDDITATYDQDYTLPTNQYSMPAYRFVGWNTAADGTGKAYADGAVVKNLSTGGFPVKLYAQWEALPYTVTFTSERPDTIGHMDDQTLLYDESEKLLPNKFESPGYQFVGWLLRGVEPTRYSDEDVVHNLTTLDSAGVPRKVELVALWETEGEPLVVVSEDSMPVGVVPQNISFWQGDVERGVGQTTIVSPGVYANKALDPGNYEVRIADYATSYSYQGVTYSSTLSVDEKGSGLLFIDFYTVEKQAGSNTGMSLRDPETGAGGDAFARVIEGRPLALDSWTDEGFVFEQYSALGTSPTWDPDESVAKQIIRINGETYLESHARNVLYQVAFDGNGATGGSMNNQDMVYGESQNLFAQQYARDHYTFAGWNTAPNGTGVSYADGAQVENLTAEDGGAVTLYAQWTPDGYFVRYNDNGADGLMLDQKLFYDLSSPLASSEFTRELYHFTGWNTKSDGTGTAYAEEQDVVNLLPEDGTNPVTLYAQWERDTYRVHFEPQEGTGTMADDLPWSGVSYPLSSSTFVREGYSFAGWNTKPDGSGTPFSNGEQVLDLAEPGEMVVLYAQWKANEDPVKPDPDPGPGPGPDPDHSGGGSIQPQKPGALSPTGDALAPAFGGALSLALLAAGCALGARRGRSDR